MSIIAATIAHNEPAWVKALTFGGIPTATDVRDTPDLIALCDDGCRLLIERKTPDDFLNSLRSDGNLFGQMAGLANAHIQELLTTGKSHQWPYLIITGNLAPGPNGKVVSDRGLTGWGYASVQGALLSIQEMGVFVVVCAGDVDYEACVMRLAKRDRSSIQHILPPRPPAILPPEYSVLACLGIWPERAKTLLNYCGSLENALYELNATTNTELPGINRGDRKKVQIAMQNTHTHKETIK